MTEEIKTGYVKCLVYTLDGKEAMAEFTPNQIKVAINRAKKKDKASFLKSMAGFTSTIFNW